MASQFTVSVDQLRNRAAEMKIQNNTLKSEIENLITQEGSLSAMWEGEAKQAFRNNFRLDVDKMKEFHGVVEKYISALMQIADKYAKTEEKNVVIANTGRS